MKIQICIENSTFQHIGKGVGGTNFSATSGMLSIPFYFGLTLNQT